MTEIESRLKRLERQNRRLRWVLGLTAAACAGAFAGLPRMDAFAQAQPRTISAERFELRRANGSIAGVFGTTPAGGLNLVLLDAQGRARATIGLDPGGNPGLVLLSPAGKQRMTLADTSQGPAMILFDGAENIRWAASVESNGLPQLEFRNAQGATTWKPQ
jgi:hypothetical protein